MQSRKMTTTQATHSMFKVYKSETAFQKDCLEWIKKNFNHKLIAVNIHGGGFTNKGFPDLIIFGANKAIVVELKCENTNYKLQEDQQVWKNRFDKIGTHHFVISNMSDFQSTIKKEFLL